MPNPNGFPTPGTVLWAQDVALDRDVFRSGAAGKANVDYLRFTDLDIGIEGRISEEDARIHMMEPGQGISLFLERMIPEGLVVMGLANWNGVPKKDKKKIHWWGIDQGHPIPSGLRIVYDGQPPGHCTLTVIRTMTVQAFLALVTQVPFSSRGSDMVGPIHSMT